MKKVLLALAVFSALSLSLSSCCKTCTHTTLGSITVCEKDYSTKADYDNAVSTYEAFGYTCK